MVELQQPMGFNIGIGQYSKVGLVKREKSILFLEESD
jgi:hypothetical protein